MNPLQKKTKQKTKQNKQKPVKKNEIETQRNREQSGGYQGLGSEEWGKIGDVGQKVQTSNHESSKFYGSIVQHSDYN